MVTAGLLYPCYTVLTMNTSPETDSAFTKLRHELIDTYVRKAGVYDRKVLKAMRTIPRHLFVPKSLLSAAYENTALTIGYGQTISQPSLVGVMTQLLHLNDNEKVLEVGTGSGYQTAILSHLAKNVYTIERIPSLAKIARINLRRLNLQNIHVFTGDGTRGLTRYAPFDAIIVT